MYGGEGDLRWVVVELSGPGDRGAALRGTFVALRSKRAPIGRLVVPRQHGEEEQHPGEVALSDSHWHSSSRIPVYCLQSTSERGHKSTCDTDPEIYP